MQRHKTTHASRLERGQSLVEMALGFMLFLFVIMGLLDLGRLFFIYIALEDSAGEAALYLALNADCPQACTDQDPKSTSCQEAADAGEGDVCADPNNAFDRARKAFSNVGIDWTRVDIEYLFIAADGDAEAMVQVSLEYPFGLITPIISDIVGDDTFTLRAEAIHVRIAN